MRKVQCRHLIFGESLPKICVPLVGKTKREIEREYRRAQAWPADLLEWRADCLASAEGMFPLPFEKGGRPLLATIRTAQEGGSWTGSPAEYEAAVAELIDSGVFELVDLELSCGEERVGRLIKRAKRAGVLTVVSKHDFAGTPPREEITETLRRMAALGADLPKYAVMPQTPEDVWELLGASLQASRLCGPVIAVAMGEYGKISRIGGEYFGSAVTFAAGEEASAPGQLACKEVSGMLQTLKIQTNEVSSHE